MLSHVQRHAAIYIQVSVSFIATIIFVSLFYKPLTYFVSRDGNPAITRFTEEESNSLQPKTIVKTGLYVKDFPKFDVKNNKFQFEGVLSFEYDPKEVSAEQLDSFNFERGQIVYKSKPAIRKIGNKRLTYYTIWVEFDNDMNYKRFPFDDHQLHIVFQNQQLSPDEVIFQSNNNRFIVIANRYIEAWKGINTFTTSGYVEEVLERIEKPQTTILYPRIIFSIDYSRYSLRPLFMILLPLLGLFLILIFSLIPTNEHLYGTRLMMCTSVISALIFYLFAITPNTPKVGYMMISDFIYIYVLTCAMVIFGITLACKNLSIPFRVLINVVANSGLVILFYYLLYVQA
ncbi:MAG TPA: hypothetical protein QGF02_03530 [Candidatus Babeliales bacterium]|nr:hypothetical protein [Candidatus Babeliales bacterium]